MGFSLGIHDYAYVYDLFEILGKGARINIKRAAELTFLSGLLFVLPVYMIALGINQIRIVFLVYTAFFVLVGYIYPMSGFSYYIGDNKKKQQQQNSGDNNAYYPKSNDN